MQQLHFVVSGGNNNDASVLSLLLSETLPKSILFHIPYFSAYDFKYDGIWSTGHDRIDINAETAVEYFGNAFEKIGELLFLSDNQVEHIVIDAPGSFSFFSTEYFYTNEESVFLNVGEEKNLIFGSYIHIVVSADSITEDGINDAEKNSIYTDLASDKFSNAKKIVWINCLNYKCPSIARKREIAHNVFANLYGESMVGTGLVSGAESTFNTFTEDILIPRKAFCLAGKNIGVFRMGRIKTIYINVAESLGSLGFHDILSPAGDSSTDFFEPRRTSIVDDDMLLPQHTEEQEGEERAQSIEPSSDIDDDPTTPTHLDMGALMGIVKETSPEDGHDNEANEEASEKSYHDEKDNTAEDAIAENGKSEDELTNEGLLSNLTIPMDDDEQYYDPE